MPSYAVGKEGEPVFQVVRYSAEPTAAVLAGWARQGFVLVRLEPPRVLDQMRAITRDPAAWTIRDGRLEPRSEGER